MTEHINTPEEHERFRELIKDVGQAVTEYSGAILQLYPESCEMHEELTSPGLVTITFVLRARRIK